MDKIKSMDFFDDIQMAHSFFLATVTAQTFISMKPVNVFIELEQFVNLLIYYLLILSELFIIPGFSVTKRSFQFMRIVLQSGGTNSTRHITRNDLE